MKRKYFIYDEKSDECDLCLPAYDKINKGATRHLHNAREEQHQISNSSDVTNTESNTFPTIMIVLEPPPDYSFI